METAQAGGRQELVRDGALFSLSTGVALFLNFLTGLVVARFLGPSAFGVWNLLLIILQYSQWLQLGMLNAMNREIPRQRGRGDLEYARRIRDLVWTVGLAPISVLSLGLFLASLLSISNLDPLTRSGIRYAAVLAILRHIYAFLTTLYKAHTEFVPVAKQQLIFAVLGLLFGAPLSVIAGFHGFMLSQVSSTTLVILYSLFRWPVRLSFCFDGKEVLRLARIGFPIWLAGVVHQLYRTLDRILIGLCLGATQLGYYGLTMMAQLAVGLGPRAIGEVMYPRLSERYGAAGDSKALRGLVIAPTLALAYTMPLVVGWAYLAWPAVVRIVLPEYAPGLRAVRLFTLGIFFMCFEGAGNFLNAVDKQYQYVGILGLATFATGLVMWVMLGTGFGIEGVALASLVGTAGYVTVLNCYTFSHFFDRRGEYLRMFARMYFPFVYMCGAVWAVERSLAGGLDGDIGEAVTRVLVRGAVYTGAVLPLFVVGARRVGFPWGGRTARCVIEGRVGL